jgi:Family of unknown function (DUF6200)
MESMETGVTSEPQIIVVDLGERQQPDVVNQLRKGKGKLLDHVERIIGDLVAAGAVSASAQPVVLVVREASSSDDDDEDDE